VRWASFEREKDGITTAIQAAPFLFVSITSLQFRSKHTLKLQQKLQALMLQYQYFCKEKKV